MTNTPIYSTEAFDETTAGYLDYDQGSVDYSGAHATKMYPLTAAGEAALDAHYEAINDAVQHWAGLHTGVTAEFTDHVAVSLYGRTATAGCPEGLHLSPSDWVRHAEDALSEVIPELAHTFAGGELAPTDHGWELTNTDRTVEGFPEELVQDQHFETLGELIDALAIYRKATAAPLLRELDRALDSASDVDTLGEDFAGVDTFEEARALAARVRDHYESVEYDAEIAWEALSDLVTSERRTLALVRAAAAR